MNHLTHRFHWMFVPLFIPSTEAAVSVGAAVPARLAALEAYRRLGHVPSAVLCTVEQYRAVVDDRLPVEEPTVDEIDWTGFDEALRRVSEPAASPAAAGAGRRAQA
jgi:hypothetical protein